MRTESESDYEENQSENSKEVVAIDPGKISENCEDSVCESYPRIILKRCLFTRPEVKVRERKISSANLKKWTNSYKIIDCLEGLKKLAGNSINCIVTSPPYNKRGLCKGRRSRYEIIYDNYDDNMNESDYQDWQCRLLDEMQRVLKNDGSIFYNHKDRRFNGRDYQPEEFILKSKLKLYQTIIWDRGSTANQNASYFQPNSEKLFWLVKHENSRPKFYRERLPSKFKSSIWRINPERRNPHPAPFPIKLAEICILATTDKDDLVLDPFAGSGSTLIAADRLNRRFMGFDISRKYREMFLDRLNDLKSTQVELWSETFSVERILAQRNSKDSVEFLLKWKGYDHKYNTWEREENLNCPELLEIFRNSKRKKMK